MNTIYNIGGAIVCLIMVASGIAGGVVAVWVVW